MLLKTVALHHMYAEHGDTQESCSLAWTLGNMINCWRSLIRGKTDGLDMWRESRELWWQTPSCNVKLRGKDHEEGQQDSGWTV